MSLLNITPALGRNPFAVGALLPHTVETKNSTYVIHEHALLVDSEPTVTVVCTKGTFTNQSWVVKAADVALTRAGLRVGGNVGLHTTAPVRVNDLATETWLEALDMDAEDAAYVAKLDAMPKYSCSYHHVCSPTNITCEQYVAEETIAMQNIASTLTPTEEAIINGSWCVITLSTVNSRYTLVKRTTAGVTTAVLINDKTGEVREGAEAYVDTDGCLALKYRGRGAWVTTPIVSAYVLEN